VTSRIAIVPARGGSKRILNKNIVEFCGQPMIYWTIRSALDSGCFDRVLVSTDSTEIMRVALDCGAEVPFLRLDHGDDFAPVSFATISALEQAQMYWGEVYDVVVQLMPNCPLRLVEDIIHALDAFESSQSSFQISCTGFGWCNPWWAFSLNEDGISSPLFRGAMERRSQDMSDLFCPTGAIWIAKSEELLNSRTFYGEGCVYQPMNWISAVDIDTPDDLAVARCLGATVLNDS